MDLFIKRVKDELWDRRMDQKDLAAKTGITTATISRYLAGKMKPSAENLVSIAEALGVTTDYLLGRTNEKDFVTCASREESDNIQKRILKMMVDAGKITQEEADSGIIDPEVEDQILNMLEGAIEFSEKISK